LLEERATRAYLTRSDPAAVWCLQTWPLELIDWPIDNSHRLDIRIDPENDRQGEVGHQDTTVLPYNEQSTLRWNTNVFDLSGGSGYGECDPGGMLRERILVARDVAQSSRGSLSAAVLDGALLQVDRVDDCSWRMYTLIVK
jgi:hypothetical protein